MHPWLHARVIAVRRRLALALRGDFDPYPSAPTGTALSPSLAHRAALARAPLALAWRNAGIGDPVRWQSAARARLAALVGYGSERETPRARFSSVHGVEGGLRRVHLYLRVLPDRDVPVDVVWDPTASGARPVMICLQGTNAGAHLSWGGVRMPADPIFVADGKDYARQAARHGYVAVCVEQSCFGERRERSLAPRSPDPCIDAANHALLLGQTLLGQRVGDVSYVIDWLRADVGPELPAIDAAHVHVMGNSSGGTTALFAAALDTRISAAMPCSCIGFFRHPIGARRDPSGQNVIPGILEHLEFDDVVALVAPRPFLTVAGTADHIWPHAGAHAVIDAAREVYAAMGAEDALRALPAPGTHRFYPEIAWPAFLDLVDRSRRRALAS